MYYNSRSLRRFLLAREKRKEHEMYKIVNRSLIITIVKQCAKTTLCERGSFQTLIGQCISDNHTKLLSYTRFYLEHSLDTIPL